MPYLNDVLYKLGHGGAIEFSKSRISYWSQTLNGVKIWPFSSQSNTINFCFL